MHRDALTSLVIVRILLSSFVHSLFSLHSPFPALLLPSFSCSSSPLISTSIPSHFCSLFISTFFPFYSSCFSPHIFFLYLLYFCSLIISTIHIHIFFLSFSLALSFISYYSLFTALYISLSYSYLPVLLLSFSLHFSPHSYVLYIFPFLSPLSYLVFLHFPSFSPLISTSC